MNALVAVVVGKLFELAFAKLQGLLTDLINDLFKEWLPKIVKATVVAVAQSAGQLTVNAVDRTTDIIPGDLDDRVLDPIVGAVLGRLGIRL